jgi:hypothetical protein
VFEKRAAGTKGNTSAAADLFNSCPAIESENIKDISDSSKYKFVSPGVETLFAV